jgi:dolichyl-phosphate beta-glucosyltransferase
MVPTVVSPAHPRANIQVIIRVRFATIWDDSHAKGRAISAAAKDTDQPKLSVVIPAYNEERRLPTTLERLHGYLSSQPYTWEVLVVCNGCIDATPVLARTFGDHDSRFRAIELPERGKGKATRCGGLEARGEIVFLCDADLSMPPERLADFLSAIEKADIVAGSREAVGSHRYAEPWHRHIMGRVFNRLVQFVAVPGIDDTQCGFKAFRRDAAQDLFGQQTLDGWGFDVELLFLARKYGYVVEELGIDWFFDADTRVRPGIDTLQMIGELIAIRVRDMRGIYRAPAESTPCSADSTDG